MTAEQALARGRRLRTVLSIDNDFFPWYGAYDPAIECVIDGEPQTIDGLQLFDWSHSEAIGYFRDLAWRTRGVAFTGVGLDFERTYNVRPEKGCATYAEFVAEIKARFKLNGTVHVADSHVHAINVVTAVPAPVAEVIHFDAHHDLGYNALAVGRNARQHRADCGDWLYQALRCGWVMHAHIVYPAWDREARPGKWLDKLGGERVTWWTWPEWLQHDHGTRTDVEVFTCRSGAWAPPWLDPQWLSMARELGDVVAVGADDTILKPREWDGEAVRRSSREQLEMLLKLHDDMKAEAR